MKFIVIIGLYLYFVIYHFNDEKSKNEKEKDPEYLYKTKLEKTRSDGFDWNVKTQKIDSS